METGQERAALMMRTGRFLEVSRGDHGPGGLGERALLPSVSCESGNSILCQLRELQHVRKAALVESEDLTDRICWTNADARCAGPGGEKVPGALETSCPRTEAGPQHGARAGPECRSVGGVHSSGPCIRVTHAWPAPAGHRPLRGPGTPGPRGEAVRSERSEVALILTVRFRIPRAPAFTTESEQPPDTAGHFHGEELEWRPSRDELAPSLLSDSPLSGITCMPPGGACIP